MSNFSWRPPSVPFEAQTRDGSPFTVWHVCMICQQPRSARYHAEHPIDPHLPVLPPQSLCRRCASKSSPLPLQLSLAAALPPPSTSSSPPSVQPASSPVVSTPESAPRFIPFRHVKPFTQEPQPFVSPPPAPAPTSLADPTPAPVPIIEIMPPRAPHQPEYLVIKRENVRKWSDLPPRGYPPPMRDYIQPPGTRDYPPSVADYMEPPRDYLPPPRNHYAPLRDYAEPPTKSYPPSTCDYSVPAREYAPPQRGYSTPLQERPTRNSDHQEPFRDYHVPGTYPREPLANVKPPKRRVSFSGEDEVATLPPDLSPEPEVQSMQGLSRMRLQPPNLTGTSRPQDDYEYEKHRNHTYIDPTERPYVPEPKWTPLSESPARELHLVEESYAHGPYRAENSPTPSMEVHVDNHDFVLDTNHARSKPPSHRSEPQKAEQGDREWTRYVTVKEYRDERGPYVQVEEKIVFDDER